MALRVPTNLARISARLPVEERGVIEEAARVRAMTLSDYLRQRLVPAARQDVLSNAKTPMAQRAGQSTAP